MQTFITIAITSWLTMSILVTTKEAADRNGRNFWALCIIFAFAPIVIIGDIISEWEEENRRWKEFDKRWPKK